MYYTRKVGEAARAPPRLRPIPRTVFPSPGPLSPRRLSAPRRRLSQRRVLLQEPFNRNFEPPEGSRRLAGEHDHLSRVSSQCRCVLKEGLHSLRVACGDVAPARGVLVPLEASPVLLLEFLLFQTPRFRVVAVGPRDAQFTASRLGSAHEAVQAHPAGVVQVRHPKAR